MQIGYIADNTVPNGVPFVFFPDFNIKGLQSTIKKYMRMNVDKIVFSHSNREDPLSPGTKSDMQFWLDYIDVRS